MLSFDCLEQFCWSENVLKEKASANRDQCSGKRIYFCQRCLNHGLRNPRRNHKIRCPFSDCGCSKCILVLKRRELNTALSTLSQVKSMFELGSRGEEQQLVGGVQIGLGPAERVPNCQKCGQHGVKARLKGHKQECQFRDCECPKCSVISERQKLMAKQIKIRRRQRKEFTAGREQRTQLLMLESEFAQQQQQGQQPPANAPEIVSSSDAANANAISPPLQQPMATNSELGSSAADAGATLAYASLALKLEEICCQLLLGQRQPQDQQHFPVIMPQPLLPGILSVAEQIAAAKLLPLAKPMPTEFCWPSTMPSNSSSTSTPPPQPSAQLFQFQQQLAALLAISSNRGGLPVLANAGFHLPSQMPRIEPIIRLQQNVNVSHV